MNTGNQLAKIDNTQVVELINRLPNLKEEDKRELMVRIASDDIELRKAAYEKMIQSGIAQGDLAIVQGELAALNKKGIIMKTKQTIRTGSGTLEVEMKGGDTKLILPVLVIVGIVIIAALVIVFWR